MQTIDLSSGAALKKNAEQAHEQYSSAHAKHVEAETELGKACAIRSRLVKGLDETRRTLNDARHVAISAAINGAGFSEASARVAALQGELSLLDAVLRRYHAFGYSDSQRAALAATVEMRDRKCQSERARLAAKVAEIELGLSAVAMNSHGYIEIQMGSVTRPYEELIARLHREADEARESLKNHDMETRKLRDEVGEL